MATTSVTSSGPLDVPTLVNQLMALERKPIDKLNVQVSSYQAKISSLATLNGLVSSLQTAAQSIGTAASGYTATSSDTTALTASATSAAAAGTYAIQIANLAQAQNLVAAGQVSSTAAISNGVATTLSFDFGTISGGTLAAGTYTGATFTPNGVATKSITIDSTNNTLQGIRDAINAAQMGVTASIVNDGSGTPFRLTLTSSSTGASNSLKVTATGGDGTINALLGYNPAGAQSLSQTAAAQNANLTLNGIAISKASNTITDAIQGVTLNLGKATATSTTLTVAGDSSGVVTSATNFVSAYNALYSQLKSRSAYGATASTGGVLAGDATLKTMMNEMRNIVATAATPAAGGLLTSLSQVGITSQTDGSLALDSTKLTAAIAGNAADVTNLFASTTGFATRFQSWAKSTLAAGGTIDARTQNFNSAVTRYNDQIANLESRMTALQKRYTTTYTNLNVMLSSMTSTSNYLTQQFSRASA